MQFGIVLYIIAGIALVVSFIKDRKKTGAALKKSGKMFIGILPDFIAVIIIAGIILAYLKPEDIAKIIGEQSGFLGMILAGAVGTVSLIPGFIAFPTAAILLQNGAGYLQIAAFVSTLMTVGVVTLPLEIRYFGKKVAFIRNSLALLTSFVTAFVIYRVIILFGGV
jgi:uncharacterized membrane protein YraQ (UPF0718 family)